MALSTSYASVNHALWKPYGPAVRRMDLCAKLCLSESAARGSKPAFFCSPTIVANNRRQYNLAETWTYANYHHRLSANTVHTFIDLATMPRILVTGFHKAQCTRLWHMNPRCQIKLVPSTHSLVNCLLDMGYQVDQRTVTLGEDLSMYDQVITYLWAPRDNASTFVYETLWAISQHPDCIIALEDWQLVEKFKQLEKSATSNDMFAKRILAVNKKTMEVLKPHEDDLRNAMQIIMQKQNRLLLCAFSTAHLVDQDTYGVHILSDQLGWARDRTFTYNPNPYHRNRTWEFPGHNGSENPEFEEGEEEEMVGVEPAAEPRPESKRRRFNFASLVQSRTATWLRKQGCIGNPKKKKKECEVMRINTWPVDLYGHRASQQIRLTEDEMVKIITRDWGCLLPGYAHAGSGWWRARPLQCADAGSVLVGEDRELRVYYGDDYAYFGLTAKDVTELSDEQLRDVAAEQRAGIYNYHPLDKDVQQEEMRRVLEADG